MPKIRKYNYIIIHIPIECIKESLTKPRRHNHKIILSTEFSWYPKIIATEDIPPREIFKTEEGQEVRIIRVPIKLTDNKAKLSKEYEVQIDLYFNKENEEITRKL